MTKYNTFEAWFTEQEGYAIRAERFVGDIDWLKAAFDAGRSAQEGNEPTAEMSDKTNYENRYRIQRIAHSIDYHISALGVIPKYEDNEPVRAMHVKHLEEVLAEMKGLLQ